MRSRWLLHGSAVSASATTLSDAGQIQRACAEILALERRGGALQTMRKVLMGATVAFGVTTGILTDVHLSCKRMLPFLMDVEFCRTLNCCILICPSWGYI